MKFKVGGLIMALCLCSHYLGAADKASKSSYDQKKAPNFKADYSFSSMELVETGKDPRKSKWQKGFDSKDQSWILKDVKPGDYFIGLFSVSGRIPGSTPFPLVLNGKKILFTESTAPVKIGKGYFRELLSEKSVSLKDGDELRVRGRISKTGVERLNLYKKRPKNGIFLTRKGVINDPFSDDYFRLQVKLEEPKDFNKKAKGTLLVANLLTVEQTLNLELNVLDYFSTPVFQFKKTVKLGPKEQFEHNFEYPWGDSDRYRAKFKVTNEKGHWEEVWDQVFTSSKNKFRSKEWINNNWEIKGVKDKVFVDISQAKGGNWKPLTLPIISPKEEGCHIFWYKRKITIPEWMKNSKRIFITFTRIACDAEIYVNGKKVFYVNDPQNPCKLEITKLINRDTENEILIGTRDQIAYLAPEELKKDSVKASRFAEVIAPDGKSGLEETYLEGTPETYVESARISTYLRKKKIDVQYDLSDLEKTDYIIESSVYFKGKKVFSFDSSKITPTKPEKLFTCDISGKWADPILWSYWDPNLLCLKTDLKNKDGVVIDEKRNRFGFREIWSEDEKLFLNGTRIKMAAIAMADKHSRERYRNYIRLGKRIGLTAKVHMYTGRMFQDINDEEGILSFFSSPKVHAPSSQKFECDEYWENAARIARASVKAYWNHPSIIAWALSNEFARQNKLAMKRLKTLGESVNELGSNNMVTFCCDLDVDGWNDNISTHYPIDGSGVRYPQTYLPESALWYPVGEKLKKGMMIPCGQIKGVANIPKKSPIKWGSKPIFINETGWKLPYYVPHGFARVFGDWAYRGEYEAAEAHILLNRIFLSRHRDVEAALITPWLWCWNDPFERIIPKVDIVVLETYSRWFAGEDVLFNVNLHYDEPNSKKLKFTYKLVDSKTGKSLLEKSEDLEFQPAELKRKRINLKIPELGADTKTNLVFSLQDSDGKILSEHIIPSKIYAKKITPASVKGVLVFDPNGGTEKLFNTAKIPFTKTDAISKEILTGKNMLVLGKDTANNPILTKNTEILGEFVKNGGTVLIMNNNKGTIKWTPTPLTPITDKKTSISFRRAPNHPILSGLEDEDVKYWFPRHLLSRGDYQKPSKGSFITILDSATGMEGMEYVSMLEMPFGKGCFLASQIDFDAGGENFIKNPSAQKLLNNLVTYLAHYDKKRSNLGCVLKTGGDTEKKLTGIGVIYENANLENIDKFDVVFAEMDAVDAKMAKALKGFAQKGGTVVIHKVSLNNKALANEICDGKILLLDGHMPIFKGRVMKISDGAIIDGLGNADFYWKKLPITQSYEGSYSSSKWAKETIVENPIEIVDGTTFTYPGAIGEMQLGKGKIYVDQINWDSPNTAVVRESERIASTIFSNLNCPIREIKTQDFPTDLKYSTLDISKFLNRSLKDDVKNDGKGGWSDQGPKQDFSGLKPGKKVYKGVPFVIEKDKSCLVLLSKRRRPTLPKEVLDMPIGRKADVIYFLHSSAWTNNDMGTYRINYENGETFNIELAEEVNMRDWAAQKPDKPFYNETITKTQCAFTYKSKDWPENRSLYMMGWLNPHPKWKIKSFDFISNNNGVAILLAVTTGKIPTVAADIEIVKGDRDKAIKLYNEAKTAFEAGDKNRAEKILLESIKADQSYADAHSRLGRHYLDIGKLKDAEKQFRITLAINERTFDVYLILGEMLEKQKRYEEALAVYEKSFKVDDNQPPIHDARQRMHKVLKK